MPDISICIVSLNAAEYLRNCLRSIYEQTTYLADNHTTPQADNRIDDSNPPGTPVLEVEVLVYDNGSVDDTAVMVQDEFPQVRYTQNGENLGFTRPINLGIRQSSGQFLLVLNPDTIIMPGAINELVGYMRTHPEVGVCGPRVLNRDGSLQKSCRRGIARPWAAISYFSGLSALFPKSKFFGGYLLNYLDENSVCEVDGVSGSCMLIRRQLVDQIGYFDERFFAYQEDADYCFHAQQAGWKIVYLPQAHVIHFGGQGGSRVQPFRSIFEWHRSYYLYYKKNLAKDYFFLFNWFYYGLMGIKLLVSVAINALRTEKFAGPRRA